MPPSHGQDGPDKQMELEAGVRKDSLVVGGGHASAVGRDSDGKMTVGGTPRLVGDTQQGCCTPGEEAGPPGRSCVGGQQGGPRMTAMITGILARMAPRPAVPGQGVTEARKVTQGPCDRCRSRHQCPCSVAAGGKRARPPVLAKSSLKQRHTRWPQGPPSGTAHPYRQAAQQPHYTENLPHQTP